jgi:DNA polymerase III subunit delta
MHATDVLRKMPAVPGVAVLSGGQHHLKSAALHWLRTTVLQDEDTGLTRFPGKETDLQSVWDELRTVSMWGDRRLVIVDDADEFVTKHRAGLEKYAAAPAKKSVLVLDVKSWPKTTRLAKQIAQSGLEIECTDLKGVALTKWLQETARDSHQADLPRDAATLLIELIGEELGLLDQELSKLGSYVGQQGTITTEVVRAMVGGWRTETTWAMTDAVRDGDLASAIKDLHDLLYHGEAPQKLIGGIHFVFRKLAYATDLARQQPLEAALRTAGVFPQAVGASAAYLKRLGRPQAEKIIHQLLDTDLRLKGGSRLPERMQLERLLILLSGRM